MNTTSYYMSVTALNQISHIGRTASTGSIFNTEKIDGQDVPYVTGGSMKGILRRTGMEVMLSMLGLDPERYDNDVISDEKNPLTQNRIETLFNGSILTSGGRTVNIDEGAMLSELIPWFAVVGGCLGNTMMQGRISVKPMTLICKENRERHERIENDINRRIAGNDRIAILPTKDLKSFRHYLQRNDFTHMDDLNRLGGPASRYLPKAEKTQLIAEKTMAFLEKQEDDDWQDEKAGRHVQMRYSLQTLAANSQFYWQIDTFDLTPLMQDAFITTMSYFLSRPQVGGNIARGFGDISIEFLGRSRIEPAKAETSTDLQPSDFQIGDLYRNHLTNRRPEILQALEAIAAK